LKDFATVKSADNMSTTAATEPIWEVVRVYCDVFEYEGKKTIVYNGITLSYKKDYINHIVTIEVPKFSTMEDITKEDLIFVFRNNMEDKKFVTFKSRKIAYDKFQEILNYYNLPDLSNFVVISPIVISYSMFDSVLFKSPETRLYGVVYKTLEENNVVDNFEASYFGMDIYLNCFVKHTHKNALSAEFDE
jgi:hypothetical protein